MLGLKKPYINSLEKGMTFEEDNEKVFVAQTGVSKPMLGFWDGGISPFSAVTLDRESRKYIHVRVNNIVKTYDKDGEQTVTENFYKLDECTEDNFKT